MAISRLQSVVWPYTLRRYGQEYGLQGRSKSRSVSHDVPGMAHTNDMAHIAERELQKLIRHDTRSIAKPEQTMVREYCHEPHRPRVQKSLMAQV